MLSCCHQASVRGSPRMRGGMYQKHTFVYSGCKGTKRSQREEIMQNFHVPAEVQLYRDTTCEESWLQLRQSQTMLTWSYKSSNPSVSRIRFARYLQNNKQNFTSTQNGCLRCRVPPSQVRAFSTQPDSKVHIHARARAFQTKVASSDRARGRFAHLIARPSDARTERLTERWRRRFRRAS